MNSELGVYLAGPISGLTYNEATEWRNRAVSHLSGYATCIDPMRDKEFEDDETLPRTSCRPFCSAPEILSRDLNDIRRADVVLANLTQLPASGVSLGTLVELGYAKGLNKLIVVVVPIDSPYQHPFVTQLADVVYTDLEEALTFVASVRE